MLGPEGRDLEHVVATADGHGSEPVLVDGTVEQVNELLGERIGGQVPVCRLATQERVAQRAAHDVAGMPGRVEAVEELDDRRRDEISQAGVVGAGGHGSG